MAGDTQARGAGFAYAWVGKSTSGVPTDYANLTAGAAAATGLSRLYAAQSADFALPEDEVVAIEGDDGVDGQFNFESTSLINFQLSVGRTDYTVINDIQGTTDIDLQSTWALNLVQPKDRDFTDMFVLLSRRAQNSSSASRYENWLITLATMSDRGTAFATRAAGVQNFSVTANRVTKTFYGDTLGSGVGTKTEASAFRFYSEYPVMIDVWKEDAIATSFTASQTPRTGGTHLGWTWDTSTTPTTKSITKSSDTFTFTAGTSGELIIALYEWE